MPALAELSTIIIDCAAPSSLGAFYAKVTGWEVTADSDDDFVSLSNGGSIQLAFQRIDDYQAPGWPDSRKHAHLDLKVADIKVATAAVLAAGATMPEFQPGESAWVVLADPEGHVFCLTS